jgi:hypothetical protein
MMAVIHMRGTVGAKELKEMAIGRTEDPENPF